MALRGQFLPKPGARDISRRDFLNGVLIASGGLAVSESAPLRALAKEFRGIQGSCGDDLVADDPRLARGGNRPSTFNVAHWLRDRRLSFSASGVTLAPGCDGEEGEFPNLDDPTEFDVIVAGGGLAGLSAAFYLLRRRPGTRILLLEANQYVGGNASYDDQSPLPVKASTCGAYSAAPDYDYLIELYRHAGVDWTKYNLRPPINSYYFDESTPGIKPGYRGWYIDFLRSLGTLKSAPYDERVINDLAKCVQTFVDWGDKPAPPTEPPKKSSSRYDYLSEMSFASYLTDMLHCDPRVVDFYTAYTVDCMGGTPHYVNAHTVISFLSPDYTGKFFAYPGGTSHIATQLAHWLTKSEKGNHSAHPFTMKLQAVALRVDDKAQSSGNTISVVYFKGTEFRRAVAKALVIATQAQSARRLIEHLIDEERKAAWDEFNTVPAVVANVAVRNMTAFTDLGLGFDNYFWGVNTGETLSLLIGQLKVRTRRIAHLF